MKLPKLSEKQFQEQVLQLARLCGFRAYHTHDSRKSAAGFPDLTLIHEQRRLFVVAELKIPPNVCTPEQTAWLRAFAAIGAQTFVWTPDEWPEIQSVLGNT